VNDNWWQKLNDPQISGPGWQGLRGAARLASWGYGLASAAWHCAYDLGWRRINKARLPIIGIGNLSAGGTGKTPLVMEVVATLLEMGLKAAVISRGYGRLGSNEFLWVSQGQGPLVDSRQAGDEPYLLAQKLPVPVLVGKERAKLAEELFRCCGPLVIVGDDLFQHRSLYRDLDIVALDATQPLGNGHMLPRGPLREPASGLRRAQVLVLTRADNQASLAYNKAWLRGFWGPGPILDCRHQIAAFSDRQGRPVPGAAWQGQKVLAFCGLANPDGFYQSLQSIGLLIAEHINFPDHHWFTRKDWQYIQARACRAGVRALVCSEKDLVRLPSSFSAEPDLWVSRLKITLQRQQLARILAWGLSGWKDEPATRRPGPKMGKNLLQSAQDDGSADRQKPTR
jgi:tetraacyldisaccharide 4'-kinase